MNKLKTKFVYAHIKAAKNYAEELSYCVRLKVGAVVVKNDGIISFGYNGMPAGEENVCELEDGTTNPRVRHAEINALRKLVRSSESSVGSVMFITDAPCPICSIEISEAGVSAVVFERTYRDMTGVEQLLRKGVKVFRVDPVKREIFEYDAYHMTGVPIKDDAILF